MPKTSYRITVNWGDGSVQTVDLQPPVSQNIFFPFQITHRYLDNSPKASAPQPINVFLTLNANTGVGTAVAQLFVKNVGPQLRNVSISTPIGLGGQATLTGDVIDPGVRDAFTLLVDWGDGRGAQTVNLPAGTTSFKINHTYLVGGNLQANVTVKDDEGAMANESLGVFVTTFIFPDVIPSVPVLAATDDSGVANNDAITAVRTPHFSGTAKAGSMIEVLANGRLVGFNAATSSGQWSVAVTSALSDGTYQIAARVNDNGNISLPSQPLILVVDTTPPLASSVSDLLASSDTGASDSDNITSASTRIFVGTAEPGAIVELFAGTNRVAIANVDITGQWTAEEAQLGPGSYVMTARVTDRAGNVSSFSDAMTMTIVNTLTAPSAPELAYESDVGLSTSDGVTSETKPTFIGTADPGIQIQLLANDNVVGTGSADATGHWSITVQNTLSDARYAFTCKSVDAAGNISSASGQALVIIDRALPTAPSTPDLIASSDTGFSDIDNITSITTPSFTGRAEAGALVELFANGILVGSGIANPDGQWTIAVVTPLGDGAYQIGARATDIAGNKSPLSTPLSLTVKTPATALAITRVQNTLLTQLGTQVTALFPGRAPLKDSNWNHVMRPLLISGHP